MIPSRNLRRNINYLQKNLLEVESKYDVVHFKVDFIELCTVATHYKKKLKIPKRSSENAIGRRTDNTMGNREKDKTTEKQKNNDLQHYRENYGSSNTNPAKIVDELRCSGRINFNMVNICKS